MTAKTIFTALSEDDLKLIQGLASTKLARNMGMERRETNKELEGREKLEVRLSSALLSLICNRTDSLKLWNQERLTSADCLLEVQRTEFRLVRVFAFHFTGEFPKTGC